MPPPEQMQTINLMFGFSLLINIILFITVFALARREMSPDSRLAEQKEILEEKLLKESFERERKFTIRYKFAYDEKIHEGREILKQDREILKQDRACLRREKMAFDRYRIELELE